MWRLGINEIECCPISQLANSNLINKSSLCVCVFVCVGSVQAKILFSGKWHSFYSFDIV